METPIPAGRAGLCQENLYHLYFRERTIILGREPNYYSLTSFIMTAIELSSPKRLGRMVVLGYCDISAAGIRECECTIRARKLCMLCINYRLPVEINK